MAQAAVAAAAANRLRPKLRVEEVEQREAGDDHSARGARDQCLLSARDRHREAISSVCMRGKSLIADCEMVPLELWLSARELASVEEGRQ